MSAEYAAAVRCTPQNPHRSLIQQLTGVAPLRTFKALTLTTVTVVKLVESYSYLILKNTQSVRFLLLPEWIPPRQ